MVKLTPQAQGRTTQYANEVTIRIYIRGEDIVATEQAEQPSAALQGALGAVERQVRQRRSKIRDTRRRVTPEFEVVDGADGDEFAADGAFDEIEGDTEARPR
jgi:ribosome-associated translation inhibitor RaiA